MSRYTSRNEVDIDDRRSTYSGARSRYDDYEADINFRTGSGSRPRERASVAVKERDDYDRRGTTPAFLRDDYGQTDAGAMVLRARDREDVTYAPSRRRRSPSPERQERDEVIIRRSESRGPAPRPPPVEDPPPPRRRRKSTSREREEIIIRRDERSESVSPAPRSRRGREESREREEIIIRREERSQSRPAAPRYRERERSRDREEIIIRRDEEEFSRPRRSTTAPIRDVSREREEIIIRRDERDDTRSQRSYRPPPPPPVQQDIDRQEIIIRRDRIEADKPAPEPRRTRWEDEVRPVSRERARARSHSSVSEDEIIIRRDEREGRSGEQSRQEIIIRKTSRSRSRSPSPAISVARSARPAPPPPEPQVIYAPQIHQEVITHHRHVDHGYELRGRVRKENQYSRPPSPSPSPVRAPAPPPVRSRSLSEERIDIRRTETRNGRREDERITIRERSQSRGPPLPRAPPPPPREEVRQDNFEIQISRNERSVSRPPPPPVEEKRENFELAISRTRGGYESDEEIDYGRREVRAPRPIPEPEPEPPTIGPRYGARRDPRDGLWTEITKDLVVKEAIREMGYEYEETDEFYYVFKYMTYTDVARLVGLSEDIRRDRHKRLNEIRWENAVSPRPAIAPASPRAPLALEGPPPRRDRGHWDRDEERYVEREIVYRGGRPPPPPGWR